MFITNNLLDLGCFKDSRDGTIKNVFQTENKKIIEMSLLFNKEKRDVVCVPTHHFCNLGCKMCHLTNNKLNKSMNPISVGDFIEALIKTIFKKDLKERRTDKKDLLISFMGVGEPLLNSNLIKEAFFSLECIKKDLGYENVSYAIASMFPNYQVFKEFENIVISHHIPCKVHFSLHTPNDIKRKVLIPSSKVSVKEVMGVLKEYCDNIKKDNMIIKNYLNFHRDNIAAEIHYTLIEGINDSKKDLNDLICLLQEYQIPIKFIVFNPKGELKKSSNLDKWVGEIKKQVPGLKVKIYCPPGKEVGSSCGEFTKHYYHEECETKKQLKEFEEWKHKHLFVES